MRNLLESYVEQVPGTLLVAKCKSALEAMEVLQQEEVDIMFLDIQMPGKSGFDFLEKLDRIPNVIFTTAYRDYAVEGFELKAVDYLLKPISFDRLKQALDTYFDIYGNVTPTTTAQHEVSDFMFVRSERKMIKIDYSSIFYIESYSDYLKIHLKDQTIVTRETISAIEAKLPNHLFLRIHRSFIVNKRKLTAFTAHDVEIGETEIPIGISYKKRVFEVLKKG